MRRDPNKIILPDSLEELVLFDRQVKEYLFWRVNVYNSNMIFSDREFYCAFSNLLWNLIYARPNP